MTRNKTLLFLLIALITSCTGKKPHVYRIGFSQCAKDDWRIVMNEDIYREAMFYDNLDITIKVSDRNSQTQIDDIRSFIADNVDLLIVSPNEEESVSTAIDEAAENGIPVIIADRNVSSSSYVSFIGADNRMLGTLVADHVNDILGDKGNIVELTGSATSAPAAERSAGFEENLSEGMNIISKEDGYWEENVAYEKMKQILAAHPDIDLIFAHNDAMAYGAYRAARDAGREEQIKFIGIDGLMGERGGVKMVKDGVLEATFLYPNGASTILETAYSILKGDEVPRRINLSSAMITPTNVRLMELQDIVLKEWHLKMKTVHEKLNTYSANYNAQRSALFFTFAALLVVIITVFVLIIILRKRRQLNLLLVKQKNAMSQLAVETEKTAEARMLFFTNISHDLRTPLSLIAGPVEKLKDRNIDDNTKDTCINLIVRNTEILTRMVNQLLDFRKSDEGDLKFHPQNIDINEYLSKWNESFVLLLNEKKIAFDYSQLHEGPYNVNADIDKLERIYFNILSNAFKFTPQGGKIDVRLSRSGQRKETAHISIHNTGSYIAPEEHNDIFTRFYQSNSTKNSSGVGIGLSLAKIYAEMHGGTIDVDSSIASGTTFTISLPLIEDNKASVVASDEYDILATMPENYSTGKPVILVIDDNPDMLKYLITLLEGKYSVLPTTDSLDGLRLATEHLPDLVISDIMMPGIDGLELSRRMKSSIMSCHIPLILLTAKSLEEQRVEGYESGADSYITKPFKEEVLLSRISNLLQGREILRKSYEDGMLSIEKHSTKSDEFMSQLKNYIAENISNSSLGVEDICESLGISRTQLYRKMKSLTGLSTNEYIRIYRLKRSKQLLNSGKVNVSQAGFKVGFNSTSYFVKCFKDYFGETPNDYMSRNQS